MGASMLGISLYNEIQFETSRGVMGYRKEYRRAGAAQSSRLRRGSQHRCVICEELFDSPTLSVKVGKGRGHLLCAGLSRIGLAKLAKTSGRW